MDTSSKKHAGDGQDRTEPATDTNLPVAKRKKAYRKPELSRHEQLHGIGIGSP